MKENKLETITPEMENEIFKKQLLQKEAELKIINSVGEAMSKQLDIDTVTKIVGDNVREILSTEVTEILLLNHENGIITVPYSYYKGYQKVEPFSLGEGLTSKVINSRKPLLLGTSEEQIKNGGIFDENLGEVDVTESYLGIPILFGENVLGVVSVQSYKKNSFDENVVRLLTTLSTNMGVALQNAKFFEETNRLLKETEQRTAELAVINSVQQGLAAKKDIQSIYDLVGEKIRTIFDAQVVSIGSYDYNEEKCHFKYDIEKGERFYEEPRKFNSVDKHIIKTRKILLANKNLIQEIAKLGGKVPAPAEGTEIPKSAIWVPLLVGTTITGYISLQNVDRENAFTESDVRLLTTLANSMSVALENARLFDETNNLYEEV